MKEITSSVAIAATVSSALFGLYAAFAGNHGSPAV
jgi:hypothetical protein